MAVYKQTQQHAIMFMFVCAPTQKTKTIYISIPELHTTTTPKTLLLLPVPAHRP